MKYLLTSFLILLSSSVFSQDYSENPDGTSSYIGNCSLHMDYIGSGLELGQTIQEEIEGILTNDIEVAQNFYNSLNPLTKKIWKQVAAESGANTDDLLDLVFYFDDFEMFEIELKYYNAPVKELLVVDYGVGGGNGGFIFLELSEFGYEVVGSTFDGDILQCNTEYEFKSSEK